MEKSAELESGLDDKVTGFLKYVLSGKNRPKDLPEDAVLRFAALERDKDGRPRCGSECNYGNSLFIGE